MYVLARVFEFGAKPLDVGINGSGVYAVTILPYILQKGIPGTYFSRMFDQVGKNFEFSNGKLYRLVFDFHGVSGQVDGEATKMESSFGFLDPVDPLHHTLHAEDQLTRTEGFDDVIVRTKLESQDAVYFLASGGQDDDGNIFRPFPGTQSPADFQAVHAGNIDIQNYQGRGVLLNQLDSGFTIRDALDGEAFLAQFEFQGRGQVSIVVDQ